MRTCSWLLSLILVTGCTLPGISGDQACAELDESGCKDRPDCHPVFFDPGTCDCATAGCCARFSFCANHTHAVCSAPIVCDLPPPTCEGPYVRSFVGDCFEGCVLASECAP